MPTGYTSPVKDKDDYTFEDFVWSCARGFGALIHMREEGLDADITLPEESSYREDAIARATQKLTELKAMTLSQVKKRQDEEHNEKIESAKKCVQEEQKSLQRYNSMLAKVEAWTPPTDDHVKLRKFMIEQLTESIKFDCSGDYWKNMLEQEKVSPSTWLKRCISDTEEDIAYHTTKAREEHEIFLKGIEWIAQLQQSIPMPKKMKK
jgi:hypothetical protein